MNSEQTITKDQFIKRLVRLGLRSGLTSFPRDDVDQQVLLKSAVLMVGHSVALTEEEINRKLEVWIAQVCPIKNFDRASLRRRLVDAGYLTRSTDGARYQVVQVGPGREYFGAHVDEINVTETIQTARDDMERRKREFLAKGKET